MHNRTVFNFGEFKPRKCSISFSRDYARKGQKNKKALKNQDFSWLYLFYSPFLVAEMGFEPHGLAKFSAENLSAVILAVLTVHRTVIHCRSAVHKTLCVLLTTSELFALRAHNPVPTWLQPTLQAKRKATRMSCFLFV